jgi:nitroreductase
MLGMAECLRSISTILEWRGVPPVSKSIKFTKTISCKVLLVAPLAVQARQPPGASTKPTPTCKSGSSIYPAVHNMLLAARAFGLGATLTTLYLQFEKEAEAALGLPPSFHSYALLPIGYPLGRHMVEIIKLVNARAGACSPACGPRNTAPQTRPSVSFD